MRILVLTHLTLLISAVSCLGQSVHIRTDKTPYPYYEVRLKNILFTIGDTAIPYSLLVEPTGRFDFEEGYDFSYHKIDLARYRQIGKGKEAKTYKDTIITTSDMPFQLTSYFPPLNQDSSKFINGYDFEFGWSPHYEYEAEFSYILQGISIPKLYQSDKDSVVRIIVPEQNLAGEVRNIFQINLKQTPLEIEFLQVRHDENGEFRIIDQGATTVSKQKEIESVFAEFHKFDFNPASHFIEVDGSTQYFIEFKTAYSYFAGMRHYSDDHGRNPDNEFHFIVQELYWKNKRRE